MFPDTLKMALVKALLKKANLDLIDNNFRPVLNLAYIRKLLKVLLQVNLQSILTGSTSWSQTSWPTGHYTAQRQHFSKSRQISSVYLIARKWPA